MRPNNSQSGCGTVHEAELPLFARFTPDTCKIYDAEHSEIWTEFEKIALQLIGRGRLHYGAKAIFEVMRFNTAINAGEIPRLNNNMTAYYSRKFVAKYPQHSGFFELRERQR